jgi:hypothetical protein
MATIETVLNRRPGKDSYVLFKDAYVYDAAYNGNTVYLQLDATIGTQAVQWTGTAVALTRPGNDPMSDFVLFRVTVPAMNGIRFENAISVADITVTLSQTCSKACPYVTPFPFVMPNMPIIDIDTEP